MEERECVWRLVRRDASRQCQKLAFKTPQRVRDLRSHIAEVLRLPPNRTAALD